MSKTPEIQEHQLYKCMENNIRETVYSSAPALLRPYNFISSMIGDLAISRELAWRLLVRNITSQYRQTLLGYLWAFIPSLFITSVWVFLNANNVFDMKWTGVPYPLYVLTGVVLWQVFTDAINSPLKTISESKSLLVKVNFAREALLLSGVGEVIFNFIVRLFVLIPFCIYYSLPLSHSIILVPLGVLSLVLLGLMIGLILTPISMLYNDISRMVFVLIQPWFFLTPIIYPVTQNSGANSIIDLNPVTPVLVTTRDWIFAAEPLYFGSFITVFISTVVLLIFGWILFRLSLPHLISRLNA